jgi:hypothetical protein
MLKKFISLFFKPKAKPSNDWHFPIEKSITKPKSKESKMKPGLYANIHAKQERIKKEKAEGKPVEKMRKPGTKGAPTAKAFKESAKTAKKK